MTASTVYNSLSKLDLWFALRDGSTIYHYHVPEIIPLRWPFFRDNWEALKSSLTDAVSDVDNPDLLSQKINEFSKLVEVQRNANSNPLNNAGLVASYNAIFGLIPLSVIAPSNEESKIIQSITRTVSAYSKANFVAIRKDLQNYHDELSDLVGGSDADYNRINGRQSTVAMKTATPADIATLQTMMNSLKSVDFILANAFDLPNASIDPFALAKSNANNPDFNVVSHNSGIMIMMNYGETLADISTKYLGTPDRWLEIAIANGLKPPYVDEIGEKLLLSSNGNQNQINIAPLDLNGKDNKDKFYIGQNILLQSDAIPFPESRSVANIVIIPVSGEIVLELSGDNDLNKYKLLDNAHVRVFKPNTANSNFFIMLPTGVTDTGLNKEDPWFVSTTAADEKQALIDLRLSDSNDLVFNSSGDLAFAYGMANAQQALKSKMSTEAGTSNRHPDYGIVTVSGTKSDNSEAARASLAESITSSIKADDRFSNIETLSITTLEGERTGFLVQLVVRLAGSNTAIPMTFTITPS